MPLVQYFKNYDLRVEAGNGKHEYKILEFGETQKFTISGDRL